MAVAWKPGNGDTVSVMASSDGGSSWSEATAFSHPEGNGSTSNLSLAISGDKLAVVFESYHGSEAEEADRNQVIFCEGRLP